MERQQKAEQRKNEANARKIKQEAERADRALRATRGLEIELSLAQALTLQNQRINKARRDGNFELVTSLQVLSAARKLQADIQRIENEKLSAQDRQLKIAIAQQKASQEIENLRSKDLDRQEDIRRAVNKNITSIENEIALSRARIDGTVEKVKLEQQLAAIKESINGITEDDVALLREKLELLREQRELEEVFAIQQRTATAGAGLRAGFVGQAGQAFEQQLQSGASEERAFEIANFKVS